MSRQSRTLTRNMIIGHHQRRNSVFGARNDATDSSRSARVVRRRVDDRKIVELTLRGSTTCLGGGHSSCCLHGNIRTVSWAYFRRHGKDLSGSPVVGRFLVDKHRLSAGGGDFPKRQKQWCCVQWEVSDRKIGYEAYALKQPFQLSLEQRRNIFSARPLLACDMCHTKMTCEV